MESQVADLAHFSLHEGEIQHALGRVKVQDVDYADIYIESTVVESVSMEEGIVKRAVKSISQGAGVRAIAGEKTGFAFSNELSKRDLEIAADTARYIANSPQGNSPVPVTHRPQLSQNLYPIDKPNTEIATKDRVDLLNMIDAEARKYDPRISKVMASFNSQQKVIMVATTEGLLVGDIQPLSRLQVTCIAEDGTNRQVGSYGGGGRIEFSFYHEEDRARQYAREAARQAVLNLRAVDAPAGNMPIVLSGGWPGILLHEAIGHGLEADFNRRKTSAFSNLIGQRVASDVVRLWMMARCLYDEGR